MDIYYTPNEDSLFDSLKTHIVDESTLEPLLPYSISQARFGEENGMFGYEWEDRYPKPMLGKKHSEETKQRMSAIRKGIIPKNTGKPLSERTKINMSLAKLGKPRPDISISNKNRTGMKYKKKIKNLPARPTASDTSSQLDTTL
jgi:hypothetical protein